MARQQTYEEKRTANELLPQFLGALGTDTSVKAAAEYMGVSHWVLTRWAGQEAGLPVEHFDKVKEFIRIKPKLCAQKRGAKKKGV